jgi:hypothetical protein
MRFPRLLLGLLALTGTLLCACSTSQAQAEITLNGTLSQVGNVPFDYLAVRTEEGTLWKLDVSDRTALLPLVNRTVIVSGVPERRHGASGLPQQTLHVHSIRPVKP